MICFSGVGGQNKMKSLAGGSGGWGRDLGPKHQLMILVDGCNICGNILTATTKMDKHNSSQEFSNYQPGS